MCFKIIFFTFILFLFSCNLNDDIVNIKQENITLIYMIADNDLASFAVKDINEMERAFQPADNEKILVYIDSSPIHELPRNPVLLEIKHDESKSIKSEILISYPQQNSTDEKVFMSILKDAFEYGKPKGLVLWSHGNAWLPNDRTIPTNTKSLKRSRNNDKILFKYFGKDYSPKESVMEIQGLSEALSPYHFNYIIFDACFMGSIEVMYELRHSTDYFIASPSEILSTGFPYDKILPQMTQSKVDLVGICENFYNSYAEKEGVYKSASITLLNTRYLEDFSLYCKNTFKSSDRWHLNENNQKELQQYTRNDEQILYDLKQLMAISGNEYPNWDKLVPYQNHTEYMANTISFKNCNGISSYVFGQKKDLNEYYKKLSWHKDSNYMPILVN